MHAVARLALPNIRNIQARLRGAVSLPCSVPCWHAAPAGCCCIDTATSSRCFVHRCKSGGNSMASPVPHHRHVLTCRHARSYTQLYKLRL